MLDEALFNAVNVLARPPELVLEVVESSVSAMVLAILDLWQRRPGGRKRTLCVFVHHIGTLLSFLASLQRGCAVKLGMLDRYT